METILQGLADALLDETADEGAVLAENLQSQAEVEEDLKADDPGRSEDSNCLALAELKHEEEVLRQHLLIYEHLSRSFPTQVGEETMHKLIDQLTAALSGRPNANRSANTGGVIAIEFALHRAEQQWVRLRVAEQAAQVGAGVAAHHGLTTEEARRLADAIREGLQMVGEDEEAGRQWLKAMRAYAIAAAKEAAA